MTDECDLALLTGPCCARAIWFERLVSMIEARIRREMMGIWGRVKANDRQGPCLCQFMPIIRYWPSPPTANIPRAEGKDSGIKDPGRHRRSGWE